MYPYHKHTSVQGEKFVERLLTKDALDRPSDNVKPELLILELPEWFDEEKYNRGRRFFWDHSYAFTISIAMGIVIDLSVPSILRVTVATSRSTTVYTAYKRYVATLLHTLAWFEHDLKPGSTSWKSLHEVRKRHIRASLGEKLKGYGIVSQRDLALSKFGFFGLAFLKPDRLGIKQLRSGDWEAYNHFWRVIGYMVGIEDRYNICHETFDETRKVCEILLERGFTPCLEIVPEYFEYMSRITLDGPLTVIPLWDVETMLFYCKSLGDVPGYVCTEVDRMNLQRRLIDQLKSQPEDSGVDSISIISKNLDGQERYRKRQLYIQDYDTLENAPEYQALSHLSKWRLNCCLFVFFIYTTCFGRILINVLFYVNVLLIKYFPIQAFFRFGVTTSFVIPFVEAPLDYTKPKTNVQYYDEYMTKSASF